MFSITVELLHGTFRGDPDGTADTGRLARGEWPPSPARLFAAFVAADGTGDACRVTDGAELEWLERLPEPIIHADPDPVHQRLLPRYVVEHGAGRVEGAHQEYVGRKGTLSRPGVRVAPRSPRVIYEWDAAAPSGVRLRALRLRAARIGYIGSADSPARVRVAAEALAAPPNTAPFVPDRAGEVIINLPQPGDLSHWDRLHEAWTERGPSVSRSQFPALRHSFRYRSPLSERPPDGGEVVAWLRLGAAVSGRRVAAVTGLFKQAILSRYERASGEPPATLHGHGFGGTGYDLARYLALPDVGYVRSRGRIHGLALWMPPATASAVRLAARDAAFSIRRLVGRGVDVTVTPSDNEPRPLAARPDRWIGPSLRWATAVPAIHERRRRLDLAEIARWCRHAGLPAPIAFRSERTPLVPGAIDLAPAEVNRPGRPALPYSHVELRFERAVAGPVVIGSGRQRGFGICVPLGGRD